MVLKYFDVDAPYFIMRLSSLKAHHDRGISGISSDQALEIISLLRKYGKVFITSERPLDPGLEPFRCPVRPSDIHHIISFARLFIGDSQTMAAEAGVLGTPFIRLNDFVGRIGYLNEIENEYRLGFGIRAGDSDRIFDMLEIILNTSDNDESFRLRREKMLNDKIDTAAFMTWFIENYPGSRETMRSNPAFQDNFKGENPMIVQN